MGHMNIVERFVEDESARVGCGFRHETYEPDCFGCFTANGGGND